MTKKAENMPNGGVESNIERRLQAANQRLRVSEAAMAQSEGIYRQAIETANGIPYRINFATGEWDFIGPNAFEFFGVKSEELTRKKMHELVEEIVIVSCPGDIDILRACYESVDFKQTSQLVNDYLQTIPREDSKATSVDTCIRTPDGQAKWFNDIAIIICDDETGEPLATVGILLDITARKERENGLLAVNTQLQANDQQLRALNQQLRASEAALSQSEIIHRKSIENAGAVPYKIGFNDNNYEFIGQGCEKMFGISSEEITIDYLLELFEEWIVTGPNPSKSLLTWCKAMEEGDSELIDAMRKAFHDEIARGEAPNQIMMDYRFHGPDGKVKWVSDNCLYIFDDKTGNPNFSIGFFMDITARKEEEEELRAVNQLLQASEQQLIRSEEALSQSESVHRESIENAGGVPYKIVFSDNHYEFIGEGCEKLFGVCAEDITIDYLRELFEERIITSPNPSKKLLALCEAIKEGDREVIDARRKAFREEIARGESPNQIMMDYRFHGPDGKVKWVSENNLYLFDDKTGSPTGRIGFFMDITSRKEQEEELRAVNQQLQASEAALLRSDSIHRRSIENTGGVPYTRRLGDERYSFIGQGCKKLFGIGVEEVTVEYIRSLFEKRIIISPNPSANLLAYHEALERGDDELILASRQAFLEDISDGKVSDQLRMEYCFTDPDGETKWVSDNVLFLTDSGGGKGTEAIGIYQDITEQKKVEQERKNYQRELRTLASELSLAEERQRRRVAAELHENIGQILAMAKLKVNMLEKSTEAEKAGQPLGDVTDLLDQALEYARSLTFELYPPILDNLGLETTIKWLLEQNEKNYGMSYNFEHDIKPRRLDLDVSALLYHAVRELLVNVLKHAHASIVKVSIHRREHYVEVIISDDGVGFTPAKPGWPNKSGGFGIFNIRERMEYLGGSMEIDSTLGHGATITIKSPLKWKTTL